ncbi:MAG: hypothetical protein AUK37_09070 [Rhodobacterales bacterium CG2_30_65_12]|nr:MAG: hypothetical protein AUK37_09070 [Rhodobacterales bacterium CG2_30_65_12]
MPLPLAPITVIALRYGTVALASFALARSVERGRRDQRAEDALDEVPEGITARREPEQMNATGRLKRVIRLGSGGPGVEIDASALGRLRFRKV